MALAALIDLRFREALITDPLVAVQSHRESFALTPDEEAILRSIHARDFAEFLAAVIGHIRNVSHVPAPEHVSESSTGLSSDDGCSASSLDLATNEASSVRPGLLYVKPAGVAEVEQPVLQQLPIFEVEDSNVG